MKCVQQPQKATVVHKINGTNHDVRMNFENSVRLDISNSKTLYDITLVSSITTGPLRTAHLSPLQSELRIYRGRLTINAIC